MRVHPIDRRPTSWLLYGMGAMLVGVVGLIEASVASGAIRLFLGLGTVVTVSLLVLGWLRANRVRIVLAELDLTRKQSNGEVRGGDSLMADKPTQPKPAQPSGGQPKPGQPQPSTPKK
jgi:hypothetical protein